MSKAEVKKIIHYTSSYLDNSVSYSGRCSFMFNNDHKNIWCGCFDIDIAFMFDSLSNCIVSDFRFRLYNFNDVLVEDKNFTVKDLAIVDYDIEKIFDIVCREISNKSYPLQLMSLTVDLISIKTLIIYKFTSPKLGILGIPRYLRTDSSFLIRPSNYTESHVLAEGGGTYYFNISGLTPSWESIEAIHANTKDIFDIINHYHCCYNDIIIPAENSFYYNAKFMLYMVKEIIDLYVKAQGWDEYVDL